MEVNAEMLTRDEALSPRDSILINTKRWDRQTESSSAETAAHKFQAMSGKEYGSKRLLDLLLSAFGIILLVLCWPVIALGVKLSSPGPVIYRQKRTGQNGREFTCLKFRTMHRVNLRRLDGKPVVTRREDRRIFPFGRLLRKTNLDELPQMINVWRGEMSLVGPRPYPVEECRHWNMTFDDFFCRYAVKPGISGYAQVTGYRGGTLDETHMRKRLNRDLVYVETQSLKLDLKIIGKTVFQMLHLAPGSHVK